MKTLKFEKALSELILARGENTTWRLFDDKNLSVGDSVSFLISETLEEFAIVKITYAKETTFGELTDEDLNGHERFSSEWEMYRTYSGYYNCQVTSASPVKVIKFKLE